MPSFWPLFDRDHTPGDERTSGKDKTDTSLLDWPHHSKDPKAHDPTDGHSNLDPDGRGDAGKGWFRAVMA